MRRFLLLSLVFAAIFIVLDYLVSSALAWGLARHFGLDRDASILCIGHSHTQSGLDGPELQRRLGVPVSVYATGGANTFDRVAMIRQFFSTRPIPPRVVIYDVDYNTFNSRGISSNSYRQFYPFIDNPDMARFVRENSGSRQEFLARQLVRLLRFDNHTLNLSLRELFNVRTNLKRGRLDVPALRAALAAGKGPEVAIRVDAENLRAFEETVHFVRSRGAQLILLYIPTVDLVNDLDRDNHQRVIEMFEGFAARDPGVVFLNYNQRYEHRHELFRDPVHVNRDGQMQVTADLAIDLKPIVERGKTVVPGRSEL